MRKQLIINYNLESPTRSFCDLRIGEAFVWEKHKSMADPYIHQKVSDKEYVSLVDWIRGNPSTRPIHVEQDIELSSLCIPLAI